MQYTNPTDLVNEIKKYVIGQDEAVEQIVTFFFNYLLFHYSKDIMPNLHIQHAPIALLIGESGSGKTHLIKTLANLTGCQLIEINSKSISQEGWHGTSFKEHLIHAVQESPKHLDNSIYKIVFIDELDKICIPSYDSKGGNHSFQIQSSILKYLEGFKISTPELSIDLSKYCFILASNFQEIRNKRVSELNSIGFKNHSKLVKNRLNQELEETGMIPELLGRISNIIELNKLTKTEYKAILYSENMFYMQYKKLLNRFSIKLELSDDEIDIMLDKILNLNIGVRGLIQELTKVLNNVLYSNIAQLEIISLYFNYLENSCDLMSIKKPDTGT